MSDSVAGPASAAGERRIDAHDGGSPPPVLVAALGAAALIAVIFVALFSTGGGGDDSAAGPPSALVGAAPGVQTEGRVLLTVSFAGDGSGRIEIGPRGDTCVEPCEHSFAAGTRVTVRAIPASGSTFEGWGGSCDGDGRCSFVMDKRRALTVTLERKPVAAPASSEPLCLDDETICEDGGSAPLDDPVGASDCSDGKDNDGDGLTDAAQDPGCDADDTEVEGSASATTPPPAAPNDCADGRDNDRDGLTDSAQDPDCTEGRSESGGAATPPPAAAPVRSECADRKDNDGDGLTDKAQDPGCDADRTEAGAP